MTEHAYRPHHRNTGMWGIPFAVDGARYAEIDALPTGQPWTEPVRQHLTRIRDLLADAYLSPRTRWDQDWFIDPTTERPQPFGWTPDYAMPPHRRVLVYCARCLDAPLGRGHDRHHAKPKALAGIDIVRGIDGREWLWTWPNMWLEEHDDGSLAPVTPLFLPPNGWEQATVNEDALADALASNYDTLVLDTEGGPKSVGSECFSFDPILEDPVRGPRLHGRYVLTCDTCGAGPVKRTPAGLLAMVSNAASIGVTELSLQVIARESGRPRQK